MTTISLHVSKSKTLYLFGALLGTLALAVYAAQREVVFDIEIYYDFYYSLMADGLSSIFSCRSFEPLFCGGSYVFASLTGSAAAVHFIWAFLYFLIMLRAFLEFWPRFVSQNRYSVISFATFLFVSLNYIDPQAVSFLTRQYVAGSLLTLGVAYCLNKKNPFVPFALATLIHFGAAPIALVIFCLTRRRIDPKLIAAAVGVGIIVVYNLANFYFIDLYMDSVRYKVGVYTTQNDGTVTVMQEIKLLIYWSACIFLFQTARSNLAIAYALVYLLYLCTFANELYHLRYHKYLESMEWPSAFILFYIKREASGHLVLTALAYRLYKYASLATPEASASSIVMTVVMSFIAFVTWLSF